MAIFTDIERHMELLRRLLGDVSEELAVVVGRLSDDDVAAVIGGAAALARTAEGLGIVATGVAARRSSREAGHGGLAQKRGHRNAVALVQDLTGASRADAAKHVRLGEAVLDVIAPVPNDAGSGAPTPRPGEPAVDDTAAGVPASCEPWHAPLGRSLLAGRISSAQHDAILRGLGQPPAIGTDAAECRCAVADVGTAEDGSSDHERGDDAAEGDWCCDRCACGSEGALSEQTCPCAVAVNAAAVQAWEVAAEQLTDEAAHRTVEELARTARILRDRLDPTGAEQRYLARYQARSFRMWTDRDGIHHGSLTLDDHAAAWVRSLIDAALRPRRGGPRFVDPTEKKRAEDLTADPRTNDQLAYDLILDILRAGSLADAETVFGTRQAGIRLVTIHDTGNENGAGAGDGAPFGASFLEDTGEVLPAWLTARQACDTAIIPCTLDTAGNPLDLGREQRFFTPKQRLALALRDGGCRWKGCDRPSHYCEAHHIDHYSEGGRTDIDRGILLCAFHHMQLHHGQWRITRDRKGEFLLHPPGGGTPIELKPRLALTYAWASIDPPPKRFRPALTSR